MIIGVRLLLVDVRVLKKVHGQIFIISTLLSKFFVTFCDILPTLPIFHQLYHLQMSLFRRQTKNSSYKKFNWSKKTTNLASIPMGRRGKSGAKCNS